MIRPTLGWAALSRSALDRAEAQLTEDATGVRDEVGVLALHFGYANRFFPGTSVQQTRLRYALFVPWQLVTLMQDGRIGAGQAQAALKMAEMDLAGRLPDIQGEGTIGRNTVKHGKPVSIPPSESYWIALDRWGVLRTVAGVVPSRRDVYSNWRNWHEASGSASTLTDDEHRSLDPATRLFRADLPAPPKGFAGSSDLDFELDERERTFLRRRLADVHRPNDGNVSLLSVLVREGYVPNDKHQPWSKPVRDLADESDRSALARARDAAATSAVTRAFYLACVEHLKDERDKRSSNSRHRDHLSRVVDRYGTRASRLEIGKIALDGVSIGGLAPVLEAVQRWLGAGAFEPGDAALRAVLAEWEQKRKGRRARLTLNGHGQEARAAWNGEKASRAEPIEYRWSLVRRLLRDLNGAN